MPNMSALANKLQMALVSRGVHVTINKKQFYSRVYEKVLTSYKVEERDPVTGKKQLLCKTYKLSEVVQTLAERWQEVRDA